MVKFLIALCLAGSASYADVNPVPAKLIPLDFVILSDSGWTESDVPQQMGWINKIFESCHIGFQLGEVKELMPQSFGLSSFPAELCSFKRTHKKTCEDNGHQISSLDIAKTRTDFTRLTVYLVSKLVTYDYLPDILPDVPEVQRILKVRRYQKSYPGALANNLGSTFSAVLNALPELALTAWIGYDTQEFSDKELIIGHELAHILVNENHNLVKDGNILTNFPSDRKAYITPTQCDDINDNLTSLQRFKVDRGL